MYLLVPYYHNVTIVIIFAITWSGFKDQICSHCIPSVILLTFLAPSDKAPLAKPEPDNVSQGEPIEPPEEPKEGQVKSPEEEPIKSTEEPEGEPIKSTEEQEAEPVKSPDEGEGEPSKTPDEPEVVVSNFI